MKFKRAERATAQTLQVTDDESAVAHSAGCNLVFRRILGFRSAPPQALRYRRAPRAKANPTDDQLDQSFLKHVGQRYQSSWAMYSKALLIEATA